MGSAVSPNSDRCAISVRQLPFSLLLTAVAGVLAIGAMPAGAQTSVEPGAIERAIPQQLPPGPEASSVSVQMRETPVQLAATGRFTLGAVNIDGATVFSKKELSAYFEPLLASDVDASKLTEMAESRVNQRAA